MANGEKTEVEGIAIEAVPAYNITAGKESFHPKGRDNGYVLTLGGKRVYIAGDTEDTAEMRALKDIDIAFLPMNLPYTMSVPKAADAIRAFKPKIVYPYHYRSGDKTKADMEEFKKLVGADSGVEIRSPRLVRRTVAFSATDPASALLVQELPGDVHRARHRSSASPGCWRGCDRGNHHPSRDCYNRSAARGWSRRNPRSWPDISPDREAAWCQLARGSSTIAKSIFCART